jgi:hypothetical protein
MVHDPLFAAEVGLTLFSHEALLFFSPRLADVTRISIKSHKQAIGALMRPVRMMSLDAFAAIFPSQILPSKIPITACALLRAIPEGHPAAALMRVVVRNGHVTRVEANKGHVCRVAHCTKRSVKALANLSWKHFFAFVCACFVIDLHTLV